jgi:hypothetical protein
MNSNGQVEKVGVCHITKWMKVIFLISWLLVLGGNALAQLSDLRYSRKPLPGVSDIAEVGIVVDMGLAQDLMQPAAIVETLRPRLETLGYRVALAPTHSPDGLWVQVDCQDLPKKIDPRSSRASQQATGKNQRLVPPCQLAYGYQHEAIDLFRKCFHDAENRATFQTSPATGMRGTILQHVRFPSIVSRRMGAW